MTTGLLVFVCALVVFLPHAADVHASWRDAARRALALGAIATALLVDVAVVAIAATSIALAVQSTASRSRTGRAILQVAAIAAGLGAVAAGASAPEVGFMASILAIALNAGAIPLHLGTAAIARRDPGLVVELGAVSIAIVSVHLRFVLPGSELADAAAVPLVLWGAVAALTGALLALVQRTLVGLWSTSVSMHAGMLVAAVGAAGRGHGAAALLLVVALALALGGFGAAVTALEARVGAVGLRPGGGRVRSFPLLAGVFAFFAAAGVALPGTAGFIADDLLLHALWDESPVACALVIGASATLAIAMFRGFSAVFLGAELRPSPAGDLRLRERVSAGTAMVLLILLGVFPMWVVRGA